MHARRELDLHIGHVGAAFVLSIALLVIALTRPETTLWSAVIGFIGVSGIPLSILFAIFLGLREMLRSWTAPTPAPALRMAARAEETVYVLTNPSMPGLVKVGRTRQDLADRVYQLSQATGVPTPFEVHSAFLVVDSVASEQAAHRALSSYRVNRAREFFAGDAEQISRIVAKAI